jgi:hypothetical protein
VIPWFTISFLVIAGICKAVADTITHHFDSSVFRRKDKRFWDPSISWSYAKYLPLTKYKVDAWHLANSGMIISICFAIALHHSYTYWWAEFVAAGIIFNLSFNMFYNKVFR